MPSQLESEEYSCLQGEQFTLTVTITDEVGNAININGATLLLSVVRTLSAKETVFTATGTITSATEGICTFPVTSTNTGASGSYKYIIQITFANSEVRKTLGNFTINRA